jgi:hypothetical protein
MTEKDQGAGTTALATTHEGILDIEPGRAKANLKAIAAFQKIVRETLKEGTDYGKIPGCGDKPSLFKPGAEKVTKLLNLYEDYEFVERIEDFDRPLFHYVVRCVLRDIATGTRVASGLGSCNSRESKYRYRWIPEAELSAEEKVGAKKRGGRQTLFEFDFALKKRETSGQYGKPESHWALFDAAVKAGTARSAERATKRGKATGLEVDVDATFYQVENPEIFDEVNTIIKMGKKRAHVDATLAAGRLSELFTQDLEDRAGSAGEPPVEGSGNGGAKADPKPAADKKAEPDKEAKERAAYEAGKKKPLNNVQDEFTAPEAFEKPAGGGAGESPETAKLRQLERFAKLKASILSFGVSDQTMWDGIHKTTARLYKVAYTDLGDFTRDQLEGVLDYLAAWEDHLKTKKAAQKEKTDA